MQLDWRRRKGHLLAPLDDKTERANALIERIRQQREKMKVTRGEYEDVDHDWLDKATQSDDGESRWEHLRDQEYTDE